MQKRFPPFIFSLMASQKRRILSFLLRYNIYNSSRHIDFLYDISG